METRVLVVDDDADVRDSLRRALGYAGYEVATAVNGADALKSVCKFHFKTYQEVVGGDFYEVQE